MQATVRLLSLADSVTLLFEDRGSICRSLVVEAIHGFDLGDEDEEEMLPGDRRQNLHRAEYEVGNKLSKINKMRKLSQKMGLDNKFKTILISVLSQDRYDEITKFGGPNEAEINKAAAELEASGKVPPGMDNNTLKKSIESRGYLTIQEISDVYYDLLKNLLPKLNARKRTHQNIVNKNPNLNKIYNTSVDGDIELEYQDRNTGEIVDVSLPANETLATRIGLFGKVLMAIDPEISNRLSKQFTSIFKEMTTAMGASPEYAGPEHEGQRIYTASLYALYTVAPQLNLTAMAKSKSEEEKKKKEQEAAAEKQKEEQRKSAEDERQELEDMKRKAESDYLSHLRLVIRQASPDALKQALKVAADHFERPMKLEPAMLNLDAAPARDQESLRVANTIRTILGMPSKKQYEADIARKLRTAAAAQGTPPPKVADHLAGVTQPPPAPPEDEDEEKPETAQPATTPVVPKTESRIRKLRPVTICDIVDPSF
jgi:hypothetical protein